MLLRPMQELSMHADVFGVRVGLGSQLRHHSAINLYVAGADQFLGLAPGSDPGSGNNFLQAFSGHGGFQSGVRSGTIILSARIRQSLPRRNRMEPRLRTHARHDWNYPVPRLPPASALPGTIPLPASRTLPCWEVRSRPSSQSASGILWWS